MNGSTETRRKATFSSFGKTDVMKVNTKVFVSFRRDELLFFEHV